MTTTFAQHLLALCPDNHGGAEAQPRNPEQQARPRGNTSRTTSPTTYAGVVLMLAMGSTAASAGTDGLRATRGATSSASLNVGLVIPEQLNVNGLNSLALQADGRGGLSGATSACISGLASGQYTLSAVGSGENGRFEATDGHESMPFDVAYGEGNGHSQPLTMGEALTQLAGSGARGCTDDTPNARLSIRMNSPATNPAAKLQGALTLVIAPE